MESLQELFLVFIVSLCSALFVMPKLSKVANRIGLIDKPNERKIHKEPRPLVGGIGIVISSTFAALLFIPLQGFRGYFSGLAVLLLVGFFDDFLDVGHKKKFAAQIVATSFLMYLSKIALSNFGNLLGFGDIIVPGYGWMIWCVTVFCVVGVTNAINMIDGLDGLAGGVTFIAFVSFSFLSYLSGFNGLMLLNTAFAGAVLGFLWFNWAPSKLFMGDAGSLCLGFTLSFMAVAITQPDVATVKPVIVLIVLALPISDTITVMTRRIIDKKSPFKPDKTHLHHILMGVGFSSTVTVLIILSISIGFGCIGIMGTLLQVQTPFLFAVFMIFFVCNYFSYKWLPFWAARLSKTESM